MNNTINKKLQDVKTISLKQFPNIKNNKSEKTLNEIRENKRLKKIGRNIFKKLTIDARNILNQPITKEEIKKIKELNRLELKELNRKTGTKRVKETIDFSFLKESKFYRIRIDSLSDRIREYNTTQDTKKYPANYGSPDLYNDTNLIVLCKKIAYKIMNRCLDMFPTLDKRFAQEYEIILSNTNQVIFESWRASQKNQGRAGILIVSELFNKTYSKVLSDTTDRFKRDSRVITLDLTIHKLKKKNQQRKKDSEKQISIVDLEKILKPRELAILKMRESGFTQIEIGESFRESQQTISNWINKLVNKIEKRIEFQNTLDN